MPSALPPQIQVIELTDGVRYVLPRRQLGPLRLLGCVPMIFGLFCTGFALVWMKMASGAMFSSGGQFHWPGLFFVLFGAPFVLAGLAPVCIGLFILAGHSEIELRGGTLRAIERAGPARWSRKLPIDRIRRFNVTSARTSGLASNPRQALPPALGTLAGFSIILIEMDGRPPLKAAPAYPRDWLEALARDLADRARRNDLTVSVDEPRGIEVVQTSSTLLDEVAAQSAPAEPLSQPAGSSITLENNAQGLTLTVPPVGFFRGSAGLGVFAIFWNGFLILVTTIALTTILSGGTFKTKSGAPASPWIVALFMSIFWAVGLGMLTAALHMGRRRAIIDVVDDALLITQAGLFGTTQRQWSRQQIAAICRGPSNMTVNNRPVLELQVHPVEGKRVGFLSGRGDEDLAWVADVLRRALELPAHAPATGPPLSPSHQENPETPGRA